MAALMKQQLLLHWLRTHSVTRGHCTVVALEMTLTLQGRAQDAMCKWHAHISQYPQYAAMANSPW
jgi:hypothetical protein